MNLSVKLIGVNSQEYMPADIKEFNFTQTSDAACDSFWLTFCSKSDVGEAARLEAFVGGKKIFSGLCDKQVTRQSSNGFTVYVYARSSACVLTDNQAVPFTYFKPTARQLCSCIAESYGFTNSLPDIFSDEKYCVSMGTSCFSAINKFVNLLGGTRIYVSPDNDIRLLKISDSIESLNSYRVVSEAYTINRSKPYSKIRYKKSSSQENYNVYAKASLSDSVKIERTAYVNLSSLPQWQRENTIVRKIKESYNDYKILELKVCGYVSQPLLQRCRYNGGTKMFNDYVITEKKYMRDEYGDFTKITLKKNNKVEATAYVD